MQFYHMYGFVWPPRDAEPFHHMDPLWFPFIAAVISFCNPKPQPLAATKLFSISLILSFQECYINGIIRYIYTTFWDWLFSLSIMPLKCIQVVASVSSLCLYCLGVFHGVGVPWFHQSPVEGHQCCFQFWAITNKTAVNIHVQVFMWTQISFLWDKCPKEQLLGCMVNTFIFVRNRPLLYPELLCHFTFPVAMSDQSSFSTSSAVFAIIF